jgi:hypothetical protein
VVRNVFDHPVCASKVASQLFLIAQPPPPLEEGTSSGFTISALRKKRATSRVGLLRVSVEPIDAGLYFFAPPLAAFPVTLSLNMR